MSERVTKVQVSFNARHQIALGVVALTLVAGLAPGATEMPPSDTVSQATAAIDETTVAIRVRRKRGPKECYGFAERRQRPRFA